MLSMWAALASLLTSLVTFLLTCKPPNLIDNICFLTI